VLAVRIERELMALGGVARRADLARQTGLDLRELERRLALLVDVGSVVRAGRGVYALPSARRTAVVAVTASGVLSCISAAEQWGLPLLTVPTVAHLAIPASASRSIRGRVPKRTVLHRDDSVVAGQRFDRPDPIMALSHVAQCLPTPLAVAVLDGAVRRGLVRAEELRARRPRKGWLAHERATRLIDPGAQSIPESIARVALVASGLAVKTQVKVAGVGYVDMLVEEQVVVEIDGFAYHSGRQEFREDRRRDRMLTVSRGLPVLRFAFEDAVYRTPDLVATVHAALERLGAGDPSRPSTIARLQARVP